MLYHLLNFKNTFGKGFKSKMFHALFALLLAAPWSTLAQQSQLGDEVPDFTVRPGYRVDMAVPNLEGARFMVFDDKGVLYVSRPTKQDIVSLKDKDGDGVYETKATFVEGYKTVHGLDFKNGWIWFTQTGSVHKARDTNNDGKADEVQTVIPESKLPSEGGGHWWRSILVTDDAIYTSIGDPSNITPDTTTRRKKIWKFNLDGTHPRLFVSGIRNTEKLRLRPGTNEVWGADHNSDWFGKKLGETPKKQPITNMNPPGEFNHYVQGGFYGHPFLVGNRVPRIEYQDRKDIIDLAAKTIPPEWEFGAHWAPCGFTFLSLSNNEFPTDQRGDVYAALHGSWNSSVSKGYRIQRVLFDKYTGKPYGSLRIVSTLGKDGKKILARPVDVVEAPDGTLLFSSDFHGNIFRISYTGKGM